MQHVEDTLFVRHRREDDRHVAERGDPPADRFGELLHRVALLLDQVPLVDHDHAPLLVTDDQVENIQILRLDTGRRVEHQNADVGRFDRTDRTQHRVEFEIFGHLRLFAQPGRVDQVKIHTELVVARQDRIAGRPGDRRHDVALGVEQGIRQRRLANVRTPDHGKLRQVVRLLRPGILGQRRDHRIHHFAGSAAAHRRNAVRVAESQRVELVRGVYLVVVVDLVDHEDHFFRRAPKQVGHHHIQVGNPGRHLHEKQDYVGLLDRQHHLLADLGLENILSPHGIPAGVDYGKLAAAPVGRTVMPVARGARRIVDDRFAHPDQTVEKGALPDVGTTYYRYYTHMLR